MTIAQRLDDLNDQITRACIKAGRAPGEVSLLAASKTRGPDVLHEAISAGQIHFGENYLQESIPKIEALPAATWHFIGAIQSNKTRDIAQHFDWVHSVASIKVARRLGEHRIAAHRDPINILIQVNISDESSKSGVPPSEAGTLAKTIAETPGVAFQGLMAIPAASTDPAIQQQAFADLRTLRDDISATCSCALPHLSMGMSSDFSLAIAEGATWIRIGTALFGPRSQPGSSTT